MRIDPRAVAPFLALFLRERPCPACGSERVNVRETVGNTGLVLRAECLDCGRTVDVPRE